MLGIRIRNQFLSLYADTSLTFEKHHPIGIIMESDDEIKGGYSFPIDIPLDENNVSIIGRIDRLDTTQKLLQDEYCEVWCDGILLDTGKAYVKGSGNRRASLFMVFNEVADISDVSLEALDLGGDRTIGTDTASRLAYARDTAVNPLDYDYVFCPVLNPRYFRIDGVDPFLSTQNFQNFWSFVTDGFVENEGGVAMPFIRIDYLLKQIFKHQGYTLDNQWQVTDEQKLLIMYNNRSIYDTLITWSNTINLTNHVPYRKALELVRAVCATYALGLFYDHFRKTVLLVPYKDLINAPIAADWTAKAASDFGYTADMDYIARWRYDLDENDDLSVSYSGISAPSGPGFILGEGLTARIMQAAVQLFIRYAIADNTIYLIPPSPSNILYVAQYQNQVKKTGSDKEYISPLIPLWNSWNLHLDGVIELGDDLVFQEWMVPHIKHIGNAIPITLARQPLTSFRMMMYRGMQPADVGISGTYPMASATRYNIRGEEVGTESLHWDREDGIWEKYWKPVYHMLSNKEDVTRSLLLSIADLLAFRFQYKYRIENQNYFFSRLRYTISSKGMSPVEAIGITTL